MPVNESDARFIRDLVRRGSAIELDAAKDYLIDMRLAPLAQESGLSNVGALVARVRDGDSAMSKRVIEAITTHETSFFRDLHPFNVLRDQVLPALIAARAAKRKLHIWCAACSSGQEPYSLAMLLLEHFPQLESWDVRIVATDLSSQVLARAKQGLFTRAEVNRGLPTPLLVKYFENAGAEWRLSEAVRRRIEFRQLNLVEDWRIEPHADLVLMRNVLIYFDLPAKRRILERMRRFMAPDATLFLGAAETTLNVDDAWEGVTTHKSVYYKVKS
jgi:chemotaxis protein methyltransferase CheR